MISDTLVSGSPDKKPGFQRHKNVPKSVPSPISTNSSRDSQRATVFKTFKPVLNFSLSPKKTNPQIDHKPRFSVELETEPRSFQMEKPTKTRKKRTNGIGTGSSPWHYVGKKDLEDIETGLGDENKQIPDLDLPKPELLEPIPGFPVDFDEIQKGKVVHQKEIEDKPNRTPSKTRVRTTLETAVFALAPRVFTAIPQKPPPPDIERLYHAYLTLLQVLDSDIPVINPFQVSHHRAYHTLKGLGKAPGKLISASKGILKAVKNGTVSDEKLTPVFEELKTAVEGKTNDDDLGNALFCFLTAVLMIKNERNRELNLVEKSLDYLEVDEESPRRKLLKSLLNRRVEDQEKSVSAYGIKADLGEIRGEEGRKKGQEESAIKTVSQIIQTPLKPVLRQKSTPETSLNLSKVRSKTPDSSLKTTPRKHTPQSTDRARSPTVDRQCSNLLLDVKFRVFLKDQIRLSDFRVPETNFDLGNLGKRFEIAVKETDKNVGEDVLERFTEALDLQSTRSLIESYQNQAYSPLQEPSSWTEISLRREKAKLSTELRPLKRKT